jgi:membrane fusion protein, multidrug efflux system
MTKITLLGVLLLMSSCHSDKGAKLGAPPIEVTGFHVEPLTIPADFEFVGVAKSSHPVEIRSRVEGYLVSIDYIEGSMVDENDQLFQIDPRQFEASVEEAQGELARQEAILWRAERSLERIKPLYEKNASSLRDLDNATAQVLSAQASVIMAEANLIQADLNLSYTQIIAPVRGLVGRALFREGTLITPSINGLLTLVSVIDPIWVYFSVSDNDRLQGWQERSNEELILPEQQKYSVALQLADGSQFPYKGRVNFTSPTLDPETGAMMVRADFPNPEGKILPGQFVRATVSGAFRPDALFVPQQSVFQGRNGMYVWVVNAEHKVNARSVEVGEWYQDYWIIKRGLNKGDLVVADGVNKVQEGSLVKILSTSSPSSEKK